MSSVRLTRRKGTEWTWTAKVSCTSDRTLSASTIRKRAKLLRKYLTLQKHLTAGRSPRQRFRCAVPAKATPAPLPDSLLFPTQRDAVAAVAAAAATILRRLRRQRLNRRRFERSIRRRLR